MEPPRMKYIAWRYYGFSEGSIPFISLIWGSWEMEEVWAQWEGTHIPLFLSVSPLVAPQHCKCPLKCHPLHLSLPQFFWLSNFLPLIARVLRPSPHNSSKCHNYHNLIPSSPVPPLSSRLLEMKAVTHREPPSLPYTPSNLLQTWVPSSSPHLCLLNTGKQPMKTVWWRTRANIVQRKI